MVLAQAAFSQTYYRKNYNRRGQQKAMTQVAPSVVDYNGAKFGFGIGANFKQVLSLITSTPEIMVLMKKNHTSITDRGFHFSIAQPIAKSVELAAGLRKATLNGEWQTLLTTEVRFKFSDSWRLALEYGPGSEIDLMSARLMFNFIRPSTKSISCFNMVVRWATIFLFSS